MKKIIAVIPARGGSKGIPNKNIKDFAGNPLMVHSIEYALKSKLVNEVMVSTDDSKISKISKDAGASVIKRLPELCTDTASILSNAVQDKTIVHTTGAMIPVRFGRSDGLFNMGSALSFVQVLPPEIYIAMNGQILKR